MATLLRLLVRIDSVDGPAILNAFGSEASLLIDSVTQRPIVNDVPRKLLERIVQLGPESGYETVTLVVAGPFLPRDREVDASC